MNKKLIREAASYIFFGVLTTLVNIVVYKAANAALGKDLYLVGNVIAWVIAVAFAYVTNKLWVFESKSWERRLVARELRQFVAARLFSLGVEELGLYVMIDLLAFGGFKWIILGYPLSGEDLAKYVMQAVVILLNYVFSKLLIFRKTKGERG